MPPEEDELEGLVMEPVAEPLVEPIPEAEPDAEPLALGPEPAHAARVNAAAKGKIHLVIHAPLLFLKGEAESLYLRTACHVEAMRR